jgi:hypothetical protein
VTVPSASALTQSPSSTRLAPPAARDSASTVHDHALAALFETADLAPSASTNTVTPARRTVWQFIEALGELDDNSWSGLMLADAALAVG